MSTPGEDAIQISFNYQNQNDQNEHNQLEPEIVQNKEYINDDYQYVSRENRKGRNDQNDHESFMNSTYTPKRRNNEHIKDLIMKRRTIDTVLKIIFY